MSHEPGHIEEPQVTDYKALYEKYYNAGMTFDDASNKLLDYYGAGTLEIEALNTFYESKKKSQDGASASEPNSETVSTESTSSTVTQGGPESGGAVSPVVNPDSTPLDIVEGTPIPWTGYQLAQAEVLGLDRPENWQDIYTSRFGEGPVYELNTDKIFSEQSDVNLMAAASYIEADAFERWYNKKIENGRTNELVEQYLALETDDSEQLRGYLKSGDVPKFQLKDAIIKMFAFIDGIPEEQLTHQGLVRKYQLGAKDQKEKILQGYDEGVPTL